MVFEVWGFGGCGGLGLLGALGFGSLSPKPVLGELPGVSGLLSFGFEDLVGAFGFRGWGLMCFLFLV